MSATTTSAAMVVTAEGIFGNRAMKPPGRQRQDERTRACEQVPLTVDGGADGDGTTRDGGLDERDDDLNSDGGDGGADGGGANCGYSQFASSAVGIRTGRSTRSTPQLLLAALPRLLVFRRHPLKGFAAHVPDRLPTLLLNGGLHIAGQQGVTNAAGEQKPWQVHVQLRVWASSLFPIAAVMTSSGRMTQDERTRICGQVPLNADGGAADGSRRRI